MTETDVIVAIASGCTDSGIGVIRMSGEDALSIAAKVFQPKNDKVNIKEMKTYTAHFGYVMEDGNILDECVLLYMKAPHSYTGENTVELDVHGGMYICNRVVSLLCKCGATPAQPGEFTKRAFLNGKMDLTQAEAVMDVIRADNENALNISMKQLKGNLKEEIIQLREKIIHENAYIEYALDDPEHISLDGFSEKLDCIVEEVMTSIQSLLDHAKQGRIMKEGIRTAIVGSPNAGKSSLLNALLKEERAIVTDVPGTTRDTLEERTMVGGIPLNIVDTAGIRKTSDVVEQIGVDKAKEAVASADLILYVVDQSQTFQSEEMEIIDLIREKNVIVLLNKSDLEQKLDAALIKDKLDAPMLTVSMTEDEDSAVEQFTELIKSMFFEGELSFNHQAFITNERQKISLEKAMLSLKKVRESISLGMSEDFFTIDLLEAYEELGKIIGESVHDDLVNEIFAEFCIGK